MSFLPGLIMTESGATLQDLRGLPTSADPCADPDSNVSTGCYGNSDNNQTTLYDYYDYMYTDSEAQVFSDIVRYLDLYLIPVIILVGILGNTAAFTVFLATYLRRMSSSIYLAGLAASDTVFLIVVFMSWLYNVEIYIYHRRGWCQFFVYLAYVSSFLSVWYVVSFTVERYISVAFPFQRQHMCTSKRAKIVVISLAVMASLLYTFALWTSDVIEVYHDGMPYCIVMPQYYKLVSTITNVDTLITLVIPTVLILGSNFRIAIALAQFYRSRELLDESDWQTAVQSGNLISSQPNNNLNINSSYYRLQMKVTKMLLVVSSVFLLCNIPSHGVRVYAFIMTLIDPHFQPSYQFVLAQKLLNILYYMNFSVNFILYSISGRAFRRALMRLCKRVKHRTIEFIYKKCSLFASQTKSQPKVKASQHRRTGAPLGAFD